MDSLSGLTKLVYDTTIGKKSSSGNTASTNPSTSTSPGEIDLVNISPENVLNYIKSQAASLKSSLPGIITNSLLAGANSTNTQDPLNALMNQFVNPAQSLLSSNPPNNLSPEQLKTLQQQVAGLKNYLPTMLSNSLLAPLQDTGNSLDSLLQSMTDQLTDLANQVQQKIQG